jgi:putative hydrolase of the HAD superfamily
LISDCTYELVAFWPDLSVSSLIDVATFSVEAGTKKPDPVLYTTTAARLDLRPKHCLYVGDGGSNELSGAADVGMTSLLLYDPVGRTALVYGRDTWNGGSIGSLSELPSPV